MEPVKLGIIGCGLAATNVHWPNLKLLRDKFRIVAVSDSAEERAQEYSRVVGGVPYETDHRVLLSKHDIEAVDIVAPIPLHHPLVADALGAGKHVFVEKPLAADLRQGELMLKLDAQYPQVKMVGENFRYRRAVTRTRHIMDSGTIGRPYAGFCDFLVNFDTPDNPYARTPWRVHHKFPGGSILDVGIHWAAQLRCLFGDITVKKGFTGSINPNLGQIDSLSFHFSSGKQLDGVANFFLSAKEIYTDRMVILGTEGTIVVNPLGTSFGDVNIATHTKGEIKEEKVQNDTGFIEEFTDFFSAIRTGSPVHSSFGEAYKDLKVILDALGAP